MEQQREELTRAKKVWIEENQKLSAAEIGNVLTLNVGGTQFACSVDLLRKIPHTFFAGLVSGRWNFNRQKDGSIFIDRDPTVFPFIMTYMRKCGTGFDLAKWLTSLSDREKMLLKDEAKFYMIPHLQDSDWSKATFKPETALSADKFIRLGSRQREKEEGELGWAEQLDRFMLSSIQTIHSSLINEQKELDEEQEAFTKQKEVWREQEKRLAEVQLEAEKIISFNINGSIFSSSFDILLKLPDTFFSVIASDRWRGHQRGTDYFGGTEARVGIGEAGGGLIQYDFNPIFIDREPIIFPIIMTFMRKHGTEFDLPAWQCTLTDPEKLLLEDEAAFFMLPSRMMTSVASSQILSAGDWKAIHPNYEKRILLQHWSREAPIKLLSFSLPNMILLIKCAKGDILGAFTSQKWEYSGKWQQDKSATLFSKPSPSSALASYRTLPPEKSFCHTEKHLIFGPEDALKIQRTTGDLSMIPALSAPAADSSLHVSHIFKEVTVMELWYIDSH
jgi:hypothetical protein